MTISINQFRTGLTILIDNEIFSIIGYEHVKPGKGSAFCRAELRNLRTSQVLERTFRDSERIEEAFVQEKRLQFLYRGGGDFHFMDLEDYEQFSLTQERLGPIAELLKEGQELKGFFYKDEAFNIELPPFIDLRVEFTEPGFKGDSVKSGTKSARLETGAIVQVPLFIESGDTVRIDTSKKAYAGRVK